MEKIIRIGMDTSKEIFQLHGVNADERCVLKAKLKRRDMLAFFEKLAPTAIGIEACGASHYWSRTLEAMGHEVRMAPQHVKPYLKRSKNDARDAEALCEAMSRPTMGFVRAKSAENQAGLMLITVRERLASERTRLTNTIRGHAAEFGFVTSKGIDKIAVLLQRIAADGNLPDLARRLFANMSAELADLESRIAYIEADLRSFHKSNEVSQRLAKIPGVGPVGAVMLTLKTPDPSGFKSARQFAAWLGLTPRDHSTAGKQRHGVITRAGDEALRSVLVVGAISIIHLARSGRSPSDWHTHISTSKKPKLAAVAIANKNARIAWKLMTSGDRYDARRRGRELEPEPASQGLASAVA